MNAVQKFIQKLQGKPPVQSSSLTSGVVLMTLTLGEADAIAKKMGEMYFQCPQCGAYERVNNIGKAMLTLNPTYFTDILCIECHHPYNARVRIKKGRCPGFNYQA